MEPINLDEFRTGISGRPYNALVQHHLKRQNAQELAVAIEDTKKLLPPAVMDSLVEFSDRCNRRAYDATFWREDCAEVFDTIASDASEVMRQAGITQDNETLFNLFQLVTLNFALAASLQPNLRKFAGIKKGWFS